MAKRTSTKRRKKEPPAAGAGTDTLPFRLVGGELAPAGATFPNAGDPVREAALEAVQEEVRQLPTGFLIRILPALVRCNCQEIRVPEPPKRG